MELSTQENSKTENYNGLCDDAITSLRKNRTMSGKIRLNAVEESSWTTEELDLLNAWERESSKKSKVHGRYAEKCSIKNKWLRFTTGLVTTLAGGGSCVSFFVKLSVGQVMYSEIIYGLITFLSGLVASIGESFEWQQDMSEHQKASSEYKKISSEIRRLKSSPKLERKECEICISQLTSTITNTERDAPFVDDNWVNEYNNIQQMKRKNTMRGIEIP